MDMFRLNIILFVTIAGCITLLIEASQRDWRYVMHKVEWNCTNENIIAAQLRTVRVAPGIYGVNGTINTGGLIDKEYMVTIKIFRSPSGSNQYHMTPFGVPKTSFPEFMNTLYKKLAMEDLKNCSNFPIFEQYEDPLPIGTYHMNSCMVTTDSMPTHMMKGYYKIVLEVEGPSAYFVAELISQIQEAL